MGLSDITHESVIKAIEEYQSIGKSNFLDEYGFGEARNYFLIYQGEEYPSKSRILPDRTQMGKSSNRSG